ncbi:MAG: hypothetical protein ACYS8L_01945 [Planctomycetota bacterium]
MRLTRWFRRHRTHLLAALVVMLMLSWGVAGFLQRALQQSGQSLGRIHGERVSPLDMREAATALGVYLRLGFAEPRAIWQLQLAGAGPRAMATFVALSRDLAGFLFEEGEARSVDTGSWRLLVLKREADAAGVEVTLDEVQELLASSPVLMGEDGFSQDRYATFLRVYELADSDVRRAAVALARIAKLMNLRRGAFGVSTAELWMEYMHRGERRKIRFVEVAGDLFAPLVKAGREELESFYSEHRNLLPDPASGQVGYMAPERVRLEYAVATTTQFMQQVEITPEEISKHYEENKANFIVEDLPAEQDADQASEQEAGPDADEPAAEPRYRGLEDVRDTIRGELARAKATAKAQGLIRTVREELDAVSADYANEPLPLGQMARRYGLRHHVPRARAGGELLSHGEVEAVVPNGAAVASFAFEPTAALHYPEVFGTEDEPMICQVLERRPAEPQPFEAVEAQVKADYVRKAALDHAASFAGKLKEAVVEVGFEAAAESMAERLRNLLGAGEAVADRTPSAALDLTVSETGMFTRYDTHIAGMAGPHPGVVKEVFLVGPDEVRVVVEGPPVSNCYVVQVSEEEGASRDEFAEAGGALRLLYLAAKQNEAIQGWMRGLLEAAHRREAS